MVKPTNETSETEFYDAITGKTDEAQSQTGNLSYPPWPYSPPSYFFSTSITKQVLATEFRIINREGDPVKAGERGLLLYNGGTVCNDGFSNDSANAICRKMGYSGSSSWDSGNPYYETSRNDTEGFDITLDKVRCYNNEWSSCSYSKSHNCGHREVVFLACISGWKEVLYENNAKKNKHYSLLSQIFGQIW